MSLLVIPAAFTVLDDLGGWFARKARQLKGYAH
jgi:hypothetical protein